VLVVGGCCLCFKGIVVVVVVIEKGDVLGLIFIGMDLVVV